jgi:hypothetical protein
MLPSRAVTRLLGICTALVVTAAGATAACAGGAGAATATAQEGGASWSALTAIGASLNLAAVSCPTSTFCAIASDSDAKYDAGTMYTVSGTTLSKPTVISQYHGSPDSVSCTTSSFCVAIDNAGSVYSFNGTAWSKPQEIDSIPPANQTAVSCASSAFCAAIDDSGDVELFNGTRWTKSSEIDPSGGGYKAQNCASNQEGTCGAPAAISCASSSFCVAVDGTGSVFSFNGSNWSSAAAVDQQASIVALSCAPSSSFCVAIDSVGGTAMFNGTSWSVPTQIGGSGLDSVSCPSSDYCVAIDDSGDALRFNGTSWSPPAVVAKAALARVSCASRSFCLAITSKSSVVSFGTTSAFPQAPIEVHASRVKVTSRGTASVPISCPSGVRGCSESVSLGTREGDTTVTVTSANVKLGPGIKGTLKLKFSKPHRAQLRKRFGTDFRVTVSAAGLPIGTKLKLLLSRAN